MGPRSRHSAPWSIHTAARHFPSAARSTYNISSYLGDTLNDVLTGTNLGDFLLVQDPVGTQRICGVETILAQNSFDAMILADSYIMLGDMVIEGGNRPDLFGPMRVTIPCY